MAERDLLRMGLEVHQETAILFLPLWGGDELSLCTKSVSPYHDFSLTTLTEPYEL